MNGLSTDLLLGNLQKGLPLTIGERVRLALQLSIPAVMAQLTTILMQYLDAAMVGRLGAEASAAIGLVSTSTWLLGGLCSSLAAGFSVLVAHRIGAREREEAGQIFQQALAFCLLVSLAISVLSLLIAPYLPTWLGGGEAIRHDAFLYFLVFALSIPLWELSYLLSSMLRSAGNILIPSIVNVGACLLDVVFNYLFIFHLHMGVLGAALGTVCSLLCGLLVGLWYVLSRSEYFRLSVLRQLPRLTHTRLGMQPATVREALTIGLPMAIEHIAMCSAHIFSTIIVAPLGTAAIAANAFGITIEGLCYMPGYGIGDAATTLVGQSVGAKRPLMQRSFSYVTLLLGVGFMTLTGALMYVGIPYLMPLMTPDTLVQELTVQALRIEAFAEPWYAASIVAYAVFVGAGDTKIPCAMNLGSIWLVRLPLAMLLVGRYGLAGFWIAMATELVFRGMIFIARLIWKNYRLRKQ